MEITSPSSFKTGIARYVERLDSYPDNVRILFKEDTSGGKSVIVGFSPEEREALITLLSRGDLETSPKFNKGDIVRFYPERSESHSAWPYAAQQGSLAVVTADYDGGGYVNVRWICDRSKGQSDGTYRPKCFDVVTVDDLTDEDKQAIINRSLRG